MPLKIAINLPSRAHTYTINAVMIFIHFDSGAIVCGAYYNEKNEDFQMKKANLRHFILLYNTPVMRHNGIQQHNGMMTMMIILFYFFHLDVLLLVFWFLCSDTFEFYCVAWMRIFLMPSIYRLSFLRTLAVKVFERTPLILCLAKDICGINPMPLHSFRQWHIVQKKREHNSKIKKNKK